MGKINNIRLLIPNAIYIFFSLILMFIGGIIYIIFRPETLTMFSWMNKLGLDYSIIRNSINIDTSSKIIDFIVFSLPNGLWLLSGILFLGYVWRKNKNLFLLYSTFIFSISAIFEVGQLTNFIPGTFDFMDLAVIIISYLLGLITYKLIFRRSYEKL